MSTFLKQYQEQLLDALAAYLARLREFKNPGVYSWRRPML